MWVGTSAHPSACTHRHTQTHSHTHEARIATDINALHRAGQRRAEQGRAGQSRAEHPSCAAVAYIADLASERAAGASSCRVRRSALQTNKQTNKQTSKQTLAVTLNLIQGTTFVTGRNLSLAFSRCLRYCTFFYTTFAT